MGAVQVNLKKLLGAFFFLPHNIQTTETYEAKSLKRHSHYTVHHPVCPGIWQQNSLKFILFTRLPGGLLPLLPIRLSAHPVQ